MSHPLRKFARHVQEVIEADTSLARPSYTWCLGQVQKHYDAAKAAAEPGEGYFQRVKDRLVDLIKPNASRAG